MALTATHCRCWEPIPGILKQRQTILTAEPSFQLQFDAFYEDDLLYLYVTIRYISLNNCNKSYINLLVKKYLMFLI